MSTKTSTTYSAEAVANAFLAMARGEDRKLTNMQVQKLVYIAHGFSLALRGEALIFNKVKAFQYGPVYPKLYTKLSKFGSGKVTEKVPAEDSLAKGSEEWELLKAVWATYGQMSGFKLSSMTHADGTPWSETWKKERFSTIPDSLIAEHYRSLLPKK